MFVKNIETEHNTDIGKISEEKIFDLRDKLTHIGSLTDYRPI